MAKLIYGLNVSLDGYVDHQEFAPGVALFRYFTEQTRTMRGMVYGRGMYEIMSYWDEDQPDWTQHERDYAEVWRTKQKWVVSNSLTSVGPNAKLIDTGLEAAIKELKQELPGEIEVAGPVLAQSLTDLGLIDEYRLYYRPVVLGGGKPFFVGKMPPLRLIGHETVGEDTVRVTYAPVSL